MTNQSPTLIVLQISLVLAAGLLAAWLSRRHSSRAHLLLLLILMASFALPAISYWFEGRGRGLLPPTSGTLAVQIDAEKSHADELMLVGFAENSIVLPKPSHEESKWVGAPAVATPISEATDAGGQTAAIRWARQTAVVGWTLVSVVLVIRLFVLACASYQAQRFALPVKSAALDAELCAAAAAVGVQQKVHLCASPRISCPMIWCWGAPRVVIPTGRANDEQLSWKGIFVHELAHLKRHDHVWSLGAQLAVCLMPWHPLVALTRSWLSRLSERACDEWALHAGTTPPLYAETLLAFAPVGRATLFSPMSSSSSGLVDRVERVLSPRRSDPRVGAVWTAVAILLVVGLLSLGALTCPRAAKAQEQASAPPAAPAPSPENNASPQQENDAELPATWSDAEWRKRMTSAAKDSRWHVGAGFGARLSELAGDRAYKILEPCWAEIPVGVRKQILKGFKPAIKETPGINDRFFDIMHLGYTDPDPEVRDFTREYLNEFMLPEVTTSDDDYRRWRISIGNRPASEVIIAACVAYVKSLPELKADEIPVALKKLAGAAANLREFDAMRQAAIDNRLLVTLARWREQGLVDASGRDFRRLDYSLRVRQDVLPEAIDTTIAELFSIWKRIAAAEQKPDDDRESDILVYRLTRTKDARLIPAFIAVIDADNSYQSIYEIGNFGLGRITGIRYSPYHDGAWWKRWWQENQQHYAAELSSLEIPLLPKTPQGKRHVPFPAKLDTLDGKIEWLREQLEAGADFSLYQLTDAMADEHEDARAIPTLIAVIEAAGTEDAAYRVGHSALGPLTGVKFDPSHDGTWWRRWWLENRQRFPAEVQKQAIPDLRAAFANWNQAAEEREADELEAMFEGFPAKELHAGDNPPMRYFMIGPANNQKQPAAGWKLVLILPGGSGGSEFHAFCRNIHKHALPTGYVAAQLVAPVWSDDENRVIWPTANVNPQKGEFTSEAFIDAVVKDVSQRLVIDKRHVLALGWSSGGPPLYAESLRADKSVTGTFVAMSVFFPQMLPDLSLGKDHPYYLLHSPQDFINIDQHARTAARQLDAAGAKVKLQTYTGGHGWHEDPNGQIRRGVDWLESQIDAQAK